MGTLDDQAKLRGEWLRDDLETYRKLETWGASLFLGALGLIGKQLVEWDRAVDTSKRVALEPEVVALPALVGLVAFTFLRVVNFRSHKIVEQLRTLTGAGKQRTSASFGILGLLLAGMPLTLGFAVSWHLSQQHQDREAMLAPLGYVGIAFVGLALLVHAIMRFREWSTS
jgi:hypothetical protein